VIQITGYWEQPSYASHRKEREVFKTIVLRYKEVKIYSNKKF